MRIVAKATMPNGTNIQLEDWSENYEHLKNELVLAAFPTANRSVKGAFMPKEGEKFRASFYFSNTKTEEIFNALKKGTNKLSDYIENLANPDYAIALED